MSKEIIIHADKNQTRIALIEDGELAELHIESTDNARTLGDIYLGRVRRTMPSIQAAFIDIGQKQDAFLHYSDLADNLPQWLDFLEHDKPNVSQVKFDIEDLPQTARGGRSGRNAGNRQNRNDDEKSDVVALDADVQGPAREGGKNVKSGGRRNGADQAGSKPPEAYLDKGKRILVKIVKEPISAKGSRVSTDISLAGRFLVLVPLANYVAVSKKIFSYKERRRLRALARSLLPAGFGVIVRTVAEGKKAKELDTDLRLLLDKWRKIEKRLEGSPEPPIEVHEDVSMASSVIRDLFSDDYDRILVDDPKLYKNVKNYVQAVAPHMVPAVQLHKGKRHIFNETKIAHDVNQAFESRVDLPSGGYLFIEHTEAMHVVDVNSGRAGRGLSQEANSLKVDIEAVHAITKQIRLRDLGGIIVIDFIDLREERNRKKIYFELKKAFARDRAVTKILPMSDFGLVEITRQRLRPSITKTFSSKEDGEPVIKPQRQERNPRSVTIEGFVEKIERWITSYKAKGKGRLVNLEVHPFAAAFLNQRIPAYTTRWFLKYFIRVKLKIDESLDPLGMRFVDPKTGEAFSREPAISRRGRGRDRNRKEDVDNSDIDKSDIDKSSTDKSGVDKSGAPAGDLEKRTPAANNQHRGDSGRGRNAERGNVNRGNADRSGADRRSSERGDGRGDASKGDSERSGGNRSNAGRGGTRRGNPNRSNADKSGSDKKGPEGASLDSNNPNRTSVNKNDQEGRDVPRHDTGRSHSGREGAERDNANRNDSSRSSSNRSNSGRRTSRRNNAGRGNSRGNPRSDNERNEAPRADAIKNDDPSVRQNPQVKKDQDKPDVG